MSRESRTQKAVARDPELQQLVDQRVCVNGDGSPDAPPSKALSRECLDVLDRKMHDVLGPK